MGYNDCAAQALRHLLTTRTVAGYLVFGKRGNDGGGVVMENKKAMWKMLGMKEMKLPKGLTLGQFMRKHRRGLYYVVHNTPGIPRWAHCVCLGAFPSAMNVGDIDAEDRRQLVQTAWEFKGG